MGIKPAITIPVSRTSKRIIKSIPSDIRLKTNTVSTNFPLDILAARGNMNMTVIRSSTPYVVPINAMFATNSSIRKDIDAEIEAMTMDEVIAAIEAQFGSWVDREDITDDWVERMRCESDDRLSDLLNPPQE